MTLKEKAYKIIDAISEKKLAEVINYLEYIKIKEELEATNEILDDKKLIESIQAGLKQYENNELVDFDEIKDV
jgi:ribosomal protein L22